MKTAKEQSYIQRCKSLLYSTERGQLSTNQLIDAITEKAASAVFSHQEIIFCGLMDFIGGIASFLKASGKKVCFIDRSLDEGMFYGCPVVSLDEIEGKSDGLFIVASRSNVAFYNKVLKFYCKSPAILSFEPLLLLYKESTDNNFRKPYTYDGVKEMIEDVVINSNKYNLLLDKLADDNSKCLLSRILLFRTSFEMELNEGVKSGYPDYLDESVFRLAPDEVIADVGGFTGDTLFDFIGAFEKLQNTTEFQYYMFEPVKANLELAKRYFNASNITFLPFAVSNILGTGKMDTALVSSIGKIEIDETKKAERIEVIRLDDYFLSKRVTFIKMDIEGEEINALRGGQETIKRWMPKLAICLYHRYTDILDIFERIDAVGVSYRYYIRAHRNSLVTEYVLYAIPEGNNL